MTLVAALSGHEGVVMFADTQEIVAGYSKKNVDKLCVYDGQNPLFRFAIAGATNDATYLENLQSEMASALRSVCAYKLGTISDTLTAVLTSFYAKHIWPRATDKPHMQYLVVVQPLPEGRPETFHISETAVNVLGITTHEKSIGVGSYLADYLIHLLLGGGEPLAQLCAAAVYVATQVRENIEGVGQVERIAMFGNEGQYDELTLSEIMAIEQTVSPIAEVIKTSFDAMTDISSGRLSDDDYQDAIMGNVRDIRASLGHLNERWIEGEKRRKHLLEIYARRLSIS